MPAGKGWFGTRAVPLELQTVPARMRALVRLLFAGAVLLVLVACANAAQLLVVRGLGRRREMAVRAALGATRATLVAEALAESAVISIGAALLASTGAAAGVRILRVIGPSRFPRLAELAFDWRVAAFALGCALLVTVLTALWPIVSLTRAAEGYLAQGSSRGTVGGGQRVRQFVLGVQVAASVLLLIGSGLLVRSLVNRLHVDPGFVPAGALTFEMTLPPQSYPEQSRGPMPAIRPRIVAAIDQVLERLRSDPRVASAAVGKPLPLGGAQEVTVYVPEGVPLPPASQRPMTEYIVASDQFHDALGARLLFGRDLTAADREASQPVILVTRAFGRLAWHEDNVVGRRVKLGGSAASPAPWMTIVGVLDDIKRYDLGEQPLPTMFVPYTQGPYSSLTTVPFVVRARDGNPASVIDAARAAVAAVDPGIPVAAVQPFTGLVARASEDARFTVVLMGGFAAAALLLALAGLYGTVAFAVTLRTPELGVRIALGADARRIVRLVLRDGLWPVATGIVAGVGLALAGSRLVAALLFGVAPIDPATFALVPIAVLAASAAACAGPALRAARIDPRAALARNGMAT
jgi:predicted permease